MTHNLFLTCLLLLAVLSTADARRSSRRRRPDNHRRADNSEDSDRGEDEKPDLKDGLAVEGAVFEWGNKEYLSVAHHVSVYDAIKACEAWGGELTSIHSAAENNEIKKHIRSRYAWIGVTDHDKEGDYKNIDGTKMDFSSYARGQPNNYKNEDYTIIRKDFGAWYDSGPPRRDHPFGPQHGYICKRDRVDQVEIPEEYSCFDNFRFWDVADCLESTPGSSGSYQTITSIRQDRAEFCTAAFNSTLSRGKNIPETDTYIFTMTLESLEGFMNSRDRGHLGVAFNIRDATHYDFIYFRVHTPSHCYSVGYRDGSHVQTTDSGPCEGIAIGGRDDVLISLIVSGHSVQVKADGIEIKSYTSRYPGKNSAAALTRNGKYYHSNKVGFKGTRICQEVQCKVEVDGEMREFDYGTTVRTKKCETCTCKKLGQVSCACDAQNDVICDADEVPEYDRDCCKHCIAKPATCHVTGDPHYYTFDKIWHHFQGVCKYVLVKTADFEVHSGNEVRYGNTAVTWTKEVMVWFKGQEYSIKKGHIFSISEVQKIVPYRKSFADGFLVDVKRVGSYTYFKIHREGLDLLTLKFDGDHRIDIEVAGIYKDTTQGLCGTWNNNVQDEYTMRDGSITTDLNEFGNSWKENDDEFCPAPPPPPHVCDDQPELWDIARDVCSVMNGTNFSPCHSAPVDRDGFYSACLVDVCMCLGDTACGCASVASYADQCSEIGISIKWRKASFCPLQCDSGFQFNHCGSECLPTCSEPNPPCDPTVCVEGCFCPKGRLFLDGECVLPKDCVCTWEGQLREIDDVWDNDEKCETCTCVDAGNVVCNATVCPECPENHVPIVVDEDECCPVCVTDWLSAEDDITDFHAKVRESVTFAVVVHLPINLNKNDFMWEKRRSGVQEDLKLYTKKYDISDDGTSLTINDITLNDEGTYRLRACIDADSCGNVEFTLNVVNDIMVAVDAHKTVRELESVTLGVVINGITPEPGWKQIMWMYEGEKLLPPKSSVIKAGHERRNLTITRVVKADEGRYQCALTLADGSYHSVEFTLTVEDGDDSELLVPVATPVTALFGSNPTLMVTTPLKKVPPTAFTWMKDGAYLDPPSSDRLWYVNYRKGLQIRGVAPSDEGTYTAQMMYGKIHVRVDIILKISAANVALKTENSPLKTVVGQNAHFIVTIESGDTVPWKNIEWYKLDDDGNREFKITPPTGRYKTPDNRRRLSILKVEKSDAGVYEMEVNHKGATAKATVQLTVEDSQWVNSVQ